MARATYPTNPLNRLVVCIDEKGERRIMNYAGYRKAKAANPNIKGYFI